MVWHAIFKHHWSNLVYKGTIHPFNNPILSRGLRLNELLHNVVGLTKFYKFIWETFLFLVWLQDFDWFQRWYSTSYLNNKNLLSVSLFFLHKYTPNFCDSSSTKVIKYDKLANDLIGKGPHMLECTNYIIKSIAQIWLLGKCLLVCFLSW